MLKNFLNFCFSVEQEFPNLILHQHYPEDLLTHRLLGLASRIFNSAGQGWGKFSGAADGVSVGTTLGDTER